MHAGSYSSIPRSVKTAFAAAGIFLAASPAAVGFLLIGSPALGAPLQAREISLPMTCAELLPEAEPFRNFFEAVARGMVTSNTRLSKRMFFVLSMRQKLSASDKRSREDNPLDTLVRKTLCFFRENKEPLRAIPFDDAQFKKYIASSIDELEKKANEAVFQAEFDRLQRESYEKRLDRNRDLVERVRQEADRAAQHSFEQLTKKARRKVETP